MDIAVPESDILTSIMHALLFVFYHLTLLAVFHGIDCSLVQILFEIKVLDLFCMLAYSKTKFNKLFKSVIFGRSLNKSLNQKTIEMSRNLLE